MDGRTDGPTDGRTDGWMDLTPYSTVFSHIKAMGG